MYCPTKEDARAALLALLPRGRAWQNHEGGPEPYRYAPDSRPGSTLYRFWEAVAETITFANQRLCALALEMFCATQSETRDQWMAEYRLPDPCDPFPDLCTKVAALGGARCEYFNFIIARLGWLVDCLDASYPCGDTAGCAVAGSAQAGAGRANELMLLVYTGESPAFVGSLQTEPLAGLLTCGLPLSCPPDISSLRCLMDRIAPAHVVINYLTV